MPPNLATLFAHVMSRANEGSRGSATHCWDDVLQPASSSGSTSPGPFPMSALDWRKVEAFSLNLQSLIATRHTRCTSNGSAGGAGFSSNGGAASYSSAVAEEEHSSAAATSDEQGSSASSSNGKSILHANGKVKGKAKPVAVHASQAGAATAAAGASAAAAGTGAATPNPAVTWPRHHVPRVTPKEPSRAGEPSAPTKAVGRVASSRRVNGGAEGAVASLAVSRAGPGAFETPSHGSHHVVPPGAPVGGNQRGREHSPSRYPARLRSRRFPQLGGSRESPEPPMPRGFGSGAEAIGEGDQSQRGRRLSPRHSPTCVPRGQGRGLSADQHPHDWHGAVAGVSVQHDHGIERGDDGQNYGVRTRAAPKAGNDLPASMTLPPGACTPHVGTGAVGSRAQMDFRPAPPPIMSAAAAAAPSPKTEVAARPRQVFQDGRSGARVTPVPRSSVGGRNYTDNHVKQLALIEAAVVANATAKDRATYNLPRQGRTLTLTNVFKFVALRGAGAMYNLAMEKQVDAHTGRHSNFFDGKIDARIVGIIKKDIGDEAITKSRKFSKILLSLVAEGKALVWATQPSFCCVFLLLCWLSRVWRRTTRVQCTEARLTTSVMVATVRQILTLTESRNTQLHRRRGAPSNTSCLSILIRTKVGDHWLP